MKRLSEISRLFVSVVFIAAISPILEPKFIAPLCEEKVEVTISIISFIQSDPKRGPEFADLLPGKYHINEVQVEGLSVFRGARFYIAHPISRKLHKVWVSKGRRIRILIPRSSLKANQFSVVVNHDLVVISDSRLRNVRKN
jgi:hypothetical protein